MVRAAKHAYPETNLETPLRYPNTAGKATRQNSGI
jgi:hypothetical protein